MHPAKKTKKPAQASASLWWLHPFWIAVVPLLLFSLVAYLLPEAEYRENWRTAKAFDSTAFVICVAVAAAFSVGCLLASWINAGFSTHSRNASGPRDARFGARELKILFDVVFAVTILGYALWFGSILRQGGLGMITSMLSGGKGASDELKKSAAESIVTGVTTFTQFGMGTVLLGTYLGFTQGWEKVRLRLAMLLLVTMFRAIFLSERLSLIEVVLPSVILMIRLVGFGRPGSALRRFLLVAPVAGIAGLYALFTFTEYFRSWSTSYAASGNQSLFSFCLLRLLGYYLTALNNGAIEWHAHGALNFPYATLDWLWKFPVVGDALRAALGGDKDPVLTNPALLASEGNPELNNTSGIFPAFTDLGMAGALVYFMLFGCVARLLHGSYQRGSVAGLFLYSFLFIALSEQTRIIYVSTGRAFPTWLLLLFAVLITHPALRRGRSPRRPAVEPASTAAPDVLPP